MALYRAKEACIYGGLHYAQGEIGDFATNPGTKFEAWTADVRVLAPMYAAVNPFTGKAYPDRSLPALSGYILGLTQGYTSSTSITIQPGVVDISGKMYYLDTATAITAAVASGSLEWYGVSVGPPPYGDVLTASCFTTFALSGTPTSAINAWYLSGKRLIGYYPTASDAVQSYTTRDGAYRLALTVVDTETPPTTATSTNIGLPATFLGQTAYGWYWAEIEATVATYAKFLQGTSEVFSAAGASGTIGTRQLIRLGAQGSSVGLSVDSDGTASLLQMVLTALGIPQGFAR